MVAENNFLSLVERSIDIYYVDPMSYHASRTMTSKTVTTNDMKQGKSLANDMIEGTSLSSWKGGNLYKSCSHRKRLLASLKKHLTTQAKKDHRLHGLTVKSFSHMNDSNYYSDLEWCSKKCCLDENDMVATEYQNFLERFDFSSAFGNNKRIERDLFLIVSHNGALFEGVVLDNDIVIDDLQLLLLCTARMYRQLWWLRCILGRNVKSAFGFCVWCNHNTQKQQTSSSLSLSVCTLRLDMSTRPGQIGDQLPLFVERRQCLFTTKDSIEAIAILLRLEDYFCSVPKNYIKSANKLKQSYPGSAMVASGIYDSSKSYEKATEIIPTMTGSMVMKCHTLESLEHVLISSGLNTREIDMVRKLKTQEQKSSAWYLKCKTPVSFGAFWESPATAINSTRRRLTTLLGKESKYFSSLSKEEIAVAKDWLYMHPLDAILEPHRNFTIVRDMGLPFKGQLYWSDFLREYCKLMHQTLSFQKMSKLVHGDIHQGNLVISLTRPEKLSLIDWDEALRETPCYRKATTEEEKRRYPSALVQFPLAYTKEQFLVLFEALLQDYYPNQRRIHWIPFLESDKATCSGVLASVELRFTQLLTFLK